MNYISLCHDALQQYTHGSTQVKYLPFELGKLLYFIPVGSLKNLYFPKPLPDPLCKQNGSDSSLLLMLEWFYIWTANFMAEMSLLSDSKKQKTIFSAPHDIYFSESNYNQRKRNNVATARYSLHKHGAHSRIGSCI